MISSRIWAGLPGPVWLKLVLLFVVSGVLVVVLFEWVFPWASTFLQLQEQTVSPTPAPS